MNLEYVILAVNFLVFLWFTSAWGVFSQLSGGFVHRLESTNRELARRIEKWLEKRTGYDTVFRVIIFLNVATMATLCLVLVERRLDPKVDLTYAALMVAVGLLGAGILSELAAKIILSRFDIPLLKLTMPIINAIHNTILFPVVLVIGMVESRIENWALNEGADDRATFEDEIMSLVESDDEDDDRSLEEDERRMIKGIFDLDDTLVREIMTPRVDVKALPLEAGIDEAKQSFIDTGHSRIPVFKDTVDEIKGILFAKDFLDEASITGRSLEELAHKPIFIPETKAVDDLLEEVKRHNNHFAVVIDEYGGTAGIVTFEDIIEEIVGEIRDEYDNEDDADSSSVVMPDGSVVLDARTNIDEVNELLDTTIPDDEDVDTIGGYICGELGRIPAAGEETVLLDSVHVTILKADSRKILTIKLKVTATEDV